MGQDRYESIELCIENEGIAGESYNGHAWNTPDEISKDRQPLVKQALKAHCEAVRRGDIKREAVRRFMLD